MHLTRAPIVEALIDFRVRLRQEYPVEELMRVHDDIRNDYPTSKEVRQFQSQIQVKDGKEVDHNTVSEMLGYRFESTDKLYVVQARVNGFSISRLNPYENWESLLESCKQLWSNFRDVAGPTEITRVATRFINRIEVSLDQTVDLDDYLTAPPRVPQKLPQSVSGFLSRIVVIDPQTEASIVIVQALEQPDPAKNALPILIDIDVFRQVSMDPAGSDHWELLAKLHDLKNDAFFGSITDKTLELLK